MEYRSRSVLSFDSRHSAQARLPEAGAHAFVVLSGIARRQVEDERFGRQLVHFPNRHAQAN